MVHRSGPRIGGLVEVVASAVLAALRDRASQACRQVDCQCVRSVLALWILKLALWVWSGLGKCLIDVEHIGSVKIEVHPQLEVYQISHGLDDPDEVDVQEHPLVHRDEVSELLLLRRCYRLYDVFGELALL